MTFWQHFLRLLPLRPGPALAALYWHLTRRRVRARNRLRVASANLSFAYQLWIDQYEASESDREDQELTFSRWPARPTFGIFLHSASDVSNHELTETIRSVDNQVYQHWTLFQGQSLSAGLTALGDADYVVLLRAGDRLAKDALFQVAEEIQNQTAGDIFYCDEDRLDRKGRRSHPWFKPGWNEELFLSLDYLGSTVVLKSDLARRTARSGDSDFSSLLLKATSNAHHVVHIPKVLVHKSVDRRADKRVGAVAAHLAPRGANCSPGPFGTVKVAWPLPERLPKVSVIVPTRDKLELLKPCVESVLARTTYTNFELVIVNNESANPKTLDFLDRISADQRVRTIYYPGPYNFSAINNFALQNIDQEYACLLNNDTEVLEGAWLEEMMRYAVKPSVGAVGAKLLYADHTIQHAGVVVGLGEAAGHAHRGLPVDNPGYFRQPHASQYISAVTAACLVIEVRKFFSVGGLDETLAVAFNDVDLCLKLQAAGFRNVYVPHAVLIHHESKTRGSDMERAQFQRYLRELDILQKRWNTKKYLDPQHNPNLDRYTETFVIGI